MTTNKRTAGVRGTERSNGLRTEFSQIVYRVLDFVASLCLVFDVDWEAEDE